VLPIFTGSNVDKLAIVGTGELEIQGSSFNGKLHVQGGTLAANRARCFRRSFVYLGTAVPVCNQCDGVAIYSASAVLELMEDVHDFAGFTSRTLVNIRHNWEVTC